MQVIRYTRWFFVMCTYKRALTFCSIAASESLMRSVLVEVQPIRYSIPDMVNLNSIY